MEFGTKKLDRQLRRLKASQSFVFEFLSSGLAYSHKLSFLESFKSYLQREKERVEGELKSLEKVRAERGFNIPLTPSQVNFVRLTNLDKRINQKAFSEELRHIWFSGLSNERRLRLGVDDYLFDYLAYMETLNDRLGTRELYLKELKGQLRRNKLKSWEELCGFIRRYANRNALHVYDYTKNWSLALGLSGQSFMIEEEKYLVYFPKTNHELMDFGSRFNTCLASCQAFKFLEGQEVKLIVFKDKKLFSSLTLEKNENEIKVSMMRTYNNEEIDKSVWREVEKLVESVINKREKV